MVSYGGGRIAPDTLRIARYEALEGDMNHRNHWRMGRRAFLRAAGAIAGTWLAGDCALARRLLLVDATEADRISRVEWIVYDTGLRGVAGELHKRCAIRISTTTGGQGWADLSDWVAPADDETVHLISDALLGRSPGDHANLWRQLYEQGLALHTLSAVDIALWDLRGRIEGRPVHALLGTQRSVVPTCLSTGFNFGEPAAYADYALACKEQGLRAIKIQPYVNWDAETGLAITAFPDKDMATYLAVREAVGDEYPCMADYEGIYNYEQALRVGRLLDNLDYAWYGSPMPEDADWIDRYVALAGELRTPVCAPGHASGSYESRLPWIDRGACDISRMGIHLGGLTACLQLATACQEAGIAMELQGAGPDTYPYLQVIGATAASLVHYFEVPSPLNESHALPGRVTLEPQFDTAGQIWVPESPGMGVELDWKYIFTHRVA